MKFLMRVRVVLEQTFSVTGNETNITMIQFSGTAEGDYFQGNVIGTGVDTQTTKKDKKTLLSARYMLEGKDYTGAACKVFIENNGYDFEHCVPKVVTDSVALSGWQEAELCAKITSWEKGVLVTIYEKNGIEN